MKIILISASKGGVGKSTISAMLSLISQSLGIKVGLLDADFYGPSQRTILKENTPLVKDHTGKFNLATCCGLQFVSLAHFNYTDKSTLIRGPMISKLLDAVLDNSNWNDLDLLFVDMPPGTGDVPLSISKKMNVTGSVVVTTPQIVALEDVAKNIDMLERLNVPVLGVLENMSHYVSPNGDKHYIFGQSNVNKLIKRFDITYFGKLEILDWLSECCDNGLEMETLHAAKDQLDVLYRIANNIITNHVTQTR